MAVGNGRYTYAAASVIVSIADSFPEAKEMKTIIGILRFLAAVYQVAVGVCPECGGRIGDDGDGMTLMYEFCETCCDGNVTTRREVWRRFRINR